MSRHRTTARSILAAMLLVVLVGTASAAKPPAHIVFPVVGTVQYTDDFGAPRAGGAHQGTDIMAPKKSWAVAAEPGRVKFWTTSATAGCMLYLYGQSGTTYLYIHLNNDLTIKNDNRGKCVAGTAYAAGLKSGAKVAAGQQVGFVGDSGDANGTHAHLHFEVHPNGKKAVNPFPYLNAADHLLFAAPAGAAFVLTLKGSVVTATANRLTMNVTSVQAWPMNLKQKVNRTLTLTVPASANIQTKGGGVARLQTSYNGQSVEVWTEPAPATLRAERGDDGALSAALVSLGS